MNKYCYFRFLIICLIPVIGQPTERRCYSLTGEVTTQSRPLTRGFRDSTFLKMIVVPMIAEVWRPPNTSGISRSLR